MLFGSARARGRGFSLRDGCPLMSAACYSPRLLLRGLVTGRRQDAQGAAQAGAKHSGLFPTSAAATVSWEGILWLLFTAEGSVRVALAFCKTLAFATP